MNSTFISVLGTAVIGDDYIYAMVDEETGTVENVIDHLCPEMRIFDREQFRNTLAALNTIDNAVPVMTETTYNAMRGLLSRYHNLSKCAIVDNGGLFYITNVDGITHTTHLEDVVAVSRESLTSIFKTPKTFICFGGKSIFNAIDPDQMIISEYAIPVGQQQRFLDNGIRVKSLRKFKTGETVARRHFGNWHARKMILSDIR